MISILATKLSSLKIFFNLKMLGTFWFCFRMQRDNADWKISLYVCVQMKTRFFFLTPNFVMRQCSMCWLSHKKSTTWVGLQVCHQKDTKIFLNLKCQNSRTRNLFFSVLFFILIFHDKDNYISSKKGLLSWRLLFSRYLS